jgi:hypothetical protein
MRYRTQLQHHAAVGDRYRRSSFSKMGLLSKIFGSRDPWESVPRPYSAALQSRLSPASFQQLTALLKEYRQFTPTLFPDNVATRSQRVMCEHVAGMLLHLSFRFSETLAKMNASPLLRTSDAEHPAHAGIRNCLRLSVEIEPTDNPGSLMLPGYLLDAGLADEAVTAAARALPEWERTFAAGAKPAPLPSETSPLDAILASFLEQANGSTEILEGLRELAERRLTIQNYREQLSSSEYGTPRASLANYLQAFGITVDPNSAAAESYPLRPADLSRLAGWIAANVGVLRQHFQALDLLRVAHVLQPDFANINEVLADIYFRTQKGAPDAEDTADTRAQARKHATLAAAGMTSSLTEQNGLDGTGRTEGDLRARLARMQEILRALPGVP